MELAFRNHDGRLCVGQSGVDTLGVKEEIGQQPLHERTIKGQLASAADRNRDTRGTWVGLDPGLRRWRGDGSILPNLRVPGARIPALRSDGGRRPQANTLRGVGSIADLLPIQIGTQREVSLAMSRRKSI